MLQNVRRLIALILVLSVLIALAQYFKYPRTNLIGKWNGPDGQSLLLNSDHTGLWLLPDSLGKVNTYSFSYHYNTGTTPAELDLTHFDKGPLVGQTLYGIVEVALDGKSLRWDCELADSPTKRPRQFHPTQTQLFIKAD